MSIEFGHRIVALLPRLRAFALALARRRDQADDLVQGTCEKALRGADTWQPGTRLDSWLFRIMHNLWVDQHRRHREETTLEEAEAALQLTGEDGRESLELRLELAKVSSVIGRLATEQRAVLVLVCVEELSYREAAEVLEIPIGTVMSRLARARAAVATALAGDGQVKAAGGEA